jgi:hypothetical protein
MLGRSCGGRAVTLSRVALPLLPSPVGSRIDLLTAFLTTALRDPELDRYVPERLPSGACFPNNDPQSREDLDRCEPTGSRHRVVGEAGTAEMARGERP